MDPIQDNSLFRPTPISQIQANLAGFYSKTSRLVKEKYEDLVQFGASKSRPGPLSAESDENEKSQTARIPGLGRLIDIYA